VNKLYYGDNLEILRAEVPEESVDLVYLDPPFNSNRSYNVIFGRHPGDGDPANAFPDAYAAGAEARSVAPVAFR
jgi:DNA modification methylase